jgi:uncharacterized protein
LRQTGDLTLIPELGRTKRDALCAEFPALQDLANAQVEQYIEHGDTPFAGIRAATLRKLQRRAALLLTPDAQPVLTRPLPQTSAAVELFFDIESDPMRDLCYLHGFVIRDRATSSEHFEGIFAADTSASAERAAFADAMALFRRHADALVIHCSKHERTTYRKLAAKYPDVASMSEIETLFAGPRALDLYFDVVKPGTEWPTHDHSIKSLATHCGFHWRDADPSGASSIQWFDQWARTGDAALRQRLLDYNEDDCRAMRMVWDRLRELGCDGID